MIISGNNYLNSALNFESLVPRDVTINIARFCDTRLHSVCKTVCKTWLEIFSSPEVKCMEIGLFPSDLDILAAIKDDQSQQHKLKINVLKLCKKLIKERQFLKAERCSAFLQKSQIRTFQMNLKDNYNNLNDSFIFLLCDKEEQDYFDENKIEEISRFERLATKRLDFSQDLGDLFDF